MASTTPTTNALAAFAGNLPAYLMKGRVGSSLAILDTANNMGESLPRISFKGKSFTLIEDGEEETLDVRYLDVVVVGAHPAIARRYYEGAYDPNVVAAARCWSFDGMKPEENITDRVAASCDRCPMNEKGSHATGRGKACAMFRPLAVMLYGDEAHTGLYRIDVSALGLFASDVPGYMNLIDYNKHLKQNKVPLSCVITRISFSPKQSVPVIGFKAMGLIEEDVADAVNAFDDETINPLLLPMSGKSSPAKDAPIKEAPPKRTAAAQEEAPPKRTAVKPPFDEDEEAPPKATQKKVSVIDSQAEDDLIKQL